MLVSSLLQPGVRTHHHSQKLHASLDTPQPRVAGSPSSTIPSATSPNHLTLARARIHQPNPSQHRRAPGRISSLQCTFLLADPPSRTGLLQLPTSFQYLPNHHRVFVHGPTVNPQSKTPGKSLRKRSRTKLKLKPRKGTVHQTFCPSTTLLQLNVRTVKGSSGASASVKWVFLRWGQATTLEYPAQRDTSSAFYVENLINSI